MSRIAIIDDHIFVAESVERALSELGLGPVAVLDPDDDRLLEAVGNIAPVLCLVDLDLGSHEARGARLVEPIVALGSVVVVFTGSDDAAVFGSCLENGALGVLHKSQGVGAIAVAVQAALAGEEVNSEAEKYRWLLEAASSRREFEKQLAPFRALTKREAEVLMSICAGMSAELIASESHVSLATVRSQIRSILQKLGVHSQLGAVALCHKSGWLDTQPVPG